MNGKKIVIIISVFIAVVGYVIVSNPTVKVALAVYNTKNAMKANENYNELVLAIDKILNEQTTITYEDITINTYVEQGKYQAVYKNLATINLTKQYLSAKANFLPIEYGIFFKSSTFDVNEAIDILESAIKQIASLSTIKKANNVYYINITDKESVRTILYTTIDQLISPEMVELIELYTEKDFYDAVFEMFSGDVFLQVDDGLITQVVAYTDKHNVQLDFYYKNDTMQTFEIVTQQGNIISYNFNDYLYGAQINEADFGEVWLDDITNIKNILEMPTIIKYTIEAIYSIFFNN
ncbi:MAG: hypothetical protein ATN35_12920 [Epulopiscium sp. Nele67-Bin004]|nr:MAG: hypothetical protein ATN35_12920 [Epulopiscium sp. Nele67-Bin004]